MNGNVNEALRSNAKVRGGAGFALCVTTQKKGDR